MEYIVRAQCLSLFPRPCYIMHIKPLLFLFLGAINPILGGFVRSEVRTNSLRRRAISVSTSRLPSGETALAQPDHPAVTIEDAHPHLVRRSSTEEFWRERDRKARQNRIQQLAAQRMAERARSRYREEGLFRAQGISHSERQDELWRQRESEVATFEGKALTRYDVCWAHIMASPHKLIREIFFFKFNGLVNADRSSM